VILISKTKINKDHPSEDETKITSVTLCTDTTSFSLRVASKLHSVTAPHLEHYSSVRAKAWRGMFQRAPGISDRLASADDCDDIFTISPTQRLTR